VFGSRESGYYLRKFAWTPIVRHQIVAGTASPDGPALTDYWAERRRRTPPLGNTLLRQLQAQQGRCPICRGLLLHTDREPQTPTSRNNASRPPAKRSVDRQPPRRVLTKSDNRAAPRLIHAHRHRRIIGEGRGISADCEQADDPFLFVALANGAVRRSRGNPAQMRELFGSSRQTFPGPPDSTNDAYDRAGRVEFACVSQSDAAGAGPCGKSQCASAVLVLIRTKTPEGV
jgi:hypothetical protein